MPAEKSTKLEEKIRPESCEDNEDSPEEEIPTEDEIDNNDSVHTVKEQENREKDISLKKKEPIRSSQESADFSKEEIKEVYTKKIKEEDIFERAEQARKRAQKIRLDIFIFIVYFF